LSTDSSEGKLVADIIARISTSVGLDQASLKHVQNSVGYLEHIDQLFEVLGFCLSEEGDLLSQWRGYASDATGFSIGFSKEYLESLAETLEKQGQQQFGLYKVEYQPMTQEALVSPTFQKIKQIIDGGGLKIPRVPGLLDERSDKEIEKERENFEEAYKNMLTTVLELLSKLYTLKTQSFREEQEWRLISRLLRKGINGRIDPCSYRATNNRIVPFTKFNLIKLKEEPISEVIIGPKNLVPNYVVEKLLQQYNFNNVTVTRSRATYR